MILRCTPTILITAGLVEQLEVALCLGAVVERTPQVFDYRGAVTERASNVEQAFTAGVDMLATNNMFVLDVTAGLLHIITPTIDLRGGVIEAFPFPFTVRAGVVDRAAVEVVRIGGVVARGAAQCAVLAGTLELLAVPVELFAGLTLILTPDAALALAFNAFVMNTKTAGMGEYDNFPFTSLFKKGNDYYGITAEGLFKFIGTKDAGANIDALVVTGISDLGGRVQKYFPDAYLMLRTEGAMQFTLTVDETIKRHYPVAMRKGKQGLHTKRVNGSPGLAKGIKGNVAQVEIRNVAGADFDLLQVELVVNPTRRS